MIKISAILITISALAKGFCDSIKSHPETFPFQSDWWLANGKYQWDNRTWLEKTIFSFISDGWHLFDAIRIVSLLVIVALLLVEWLFEELDPVEDPLIRDTANYNKPIAVIAITIIAYAYHGLIFTLTFWIL